MSSDDQSYELIMLTEHKLGPIGPVTSVRKTFGLAPNLDDVPSEVTDTDGLVWKQVYLDTVDRYAIYTRSKG